ncbi:hypothetical protein JTE90_023039 [Oedothorax gibbosus]|uniref:Uncharacterized protein n=1 Tax=Oedothorax gibbosus TaxID=931172 RepID=A0AAV6V201_9ARAC|nr:hypothetical protein JTE90_023039 [Oedothorax gibbosus]
MTCPSLIACCFLYRGITVRGADNEGWGRPTPLHLSSERTTSVRGAVLLRGILTSPKHQRIQTQHGRFPFPLEPEVFSVVQQQQTPMHTTSSLVSIINCPRDAFGRQSNNPPRNYVLRDGVVQIDGMHRPEVLSVVQQHQPPMHTISSLVSIINCPRDAFGRQSDISPRNYGLRARGGRNKSMEWYGMVRGDPNLKKRSTRSTHDLLIAS